MLAAEPRRQEVGGKDAVPRLDGRIQGGAVGGVDQSRVIVDDVDPAGLVVDARERVLHFRFDAEIGDQRLYPDGMLAPVDPDHNGALLHETLGDGLADHPGRTGNHAYPAGQSAPSRNMFRCRDGRDGHAVKRPSG